MGSKSKSRKRNLKNCPLNKCSKQYQTTGRLQIHIRSKHENPTIVSLTCDTCGKTLSSERKLTAHMVLHIRVAGICCEMCPQKFMTNGKLKIHMHSDHGEKICKDCGAVGTPRWYETIHRHKHKQIKDNKVRVCHNCSHTFQSKSGLTKHMKQHLEVNKLVINMLGDVAVPDVKETSVLETKL